MALYNLILSSSGEIVNVFEWDGVDELLIPEGYYTASNADEAISTPDEFFNEQYGGDFYGNFFVDGESLQSILENTATKTEVTVVTSSRTYYPPTWTQDLKIIAIGAGGGGGAGLIGHSSHSIVLGGGGGAGGSLVRSNFNFEQIGAASGSRPLTRPRVDCFLGGIAQGGNDDVPFVLRSGSKDGSLGTNYDVWEGQFNNFAFNIYEIYTSSKGDDGSTSTAILRFTDRFERVNTYEVIAEGGYGGWGGWSAKAQFRLWNAEDSATRHQAWREVYNDYRRLPLTSPGAGASGKGDLVYSGGPGGHGIDAFTISGSTDFTLYANNAPSLPWNVIYNRTQQHSPKPFPRGILRFPWGRMAYKAFDYLGNALKSDWYNWRGKSYVSSFTKPGLIAPGGGGGGTGDRRIATATAATNYKTGTQYFNLGKGGIHAGYSLFEGETIATGGNGGTLFNQDGLTPKAATTGSGFGAGGGGGAGTFATSPAASMKGANGKPGVIIIIATGPDKYTARSGTQSAQA